MKRKKVYRVIDLVCLFCLRQGLIIYSVGLELIINNSDKEGDTNKPAKKL